MSKLKHPRVRLAATLVLVVMLGELVLWVSLQPPKLLAQLVDRVRTGQAVPSSTPVTGALTVTNSSATPTPEIVIITPTPLPPDVFAAATASVQLTLQAEQGGTPTPLPPNVRIATRTPTPRIVTATPTAENSATAELHAAQETAIAFTTGTPYVLLATATSTRTTTPTRTPGPTRTPSPTQVIVTPTLRPADVLEEATRQAEREIQAQRGELPTPLPPNYVVATVTQTPRVVTNTPPPANDATATVHAVIETAIAYTTGVPNVVTATSTATPTPNPATPTPADQTPTAEPSATQTPQALDSSPALTNTPEPIAMIAAASTPTPNPMAVLTATPTDLPSWITATRPPTVTPIPIPTLALSPTPVAQPTEEATGEATEEPLEFAPVPTWVEANRVRFPRGATSATVEAYVTEDQPVQFVLGARGGQRMSLELQNDFGDLARVDISTAAGTSLGSIMTGETWSDVLPGTGDYYLTVRVPIGGTAHNFWLWVEILP